MSVCVCRVLCVRILSVRETVVGGLRGGEAYFNGLLKEINGLQMAQSIYSNETQSLALSIEQRPGGGGWWGLQHLRSWPDYTAEMQTQTWMQLHVSMIYIVK